LGLTMQIRLSEPMLAVLREAPEIPDNLLTRVNGARQDGAEWIVSVSDDEAMAMIEMCQWSIRKDPKTGQLNEKARLFQAIVDAIDRAGEA